MAWEEDKRAGEEIEQKFIDMLKSRGWENVFQTTGKTGIDVIGINKDDRVRSFEVKYDRESANTGNVAIEMACSGEKTSISKATCDFVVYYVDNSFYHIEGALLSWLMKDRATIKGGDGGRVDMVLLEMEEFKKIFKKMA